MPTGHRFPINCTLLRRLDWRQMSTHITHRNKRGKMTRWGQEGGRSQKGVGEDGSGDPQGDKGWGQLPCEFEG